MVAGAVTGQNAIAQVRRQLPGLQSNLRDETIRAQQDARAAGRARLAEDFGPLPSVADTLIADEALAAVAGSTLSAAWATAALSLATGDEGTPAALAGLTRLIEPRLVRTASTEVARAFNDERNGILIDLGGGLGDFEPPELGDPLGPRPPGPGLFKVWSAVLDRVTCARCFACDGEIVEAHASFSAGEMPLHPHCRCLLEYVIISKPERLEDIAIDYELFKQEVRDIIRERREISDRHALGFVSDSLGEKRSPLALTKRFSEERYAVRRSTFGDGGGGGGGGGRPPGGGGGSSGGGGGRKSAPPWHTDGQVRPRGKLDESLRPFSLPERRIAEHLLSEGNSVQALLEERKRLGVRIPDALVNGRPVEFKTVSKPEVKAVVEAVRNAAGRTRRSAAQAPNVVVDLRGTGLQEHDVASVMTDPRNLKRLHGRLDHVRILGDSFDRTFSDLVP